MDNYRRLFTVFFLGLIIGATLLPTPFSIQQVFASKDSKEREHRRPSPTAPPISSGNDFRGGFFSNLSSSNFDSTFIAYHDFTGFDFSNASIRNAKVNNSIFTNTNLTNVDFTGSNLNGVNLTGANLTGVKWYNCPEGDGVCGSTTCPDGHSIGTDGATCF